MDAIFQLFGELLSNPFLLVVIIGLVSTVFGKMKGGQTEGNQPPKRQPRRPQRDMESKTASEVPHPTKRQKEAQRPSLSEANIGDSSPTNALSDVERDLQSLRRKQEKFATKARQLSAESNNKLQPRPSNQQQNKGISLQNAKQGVVWAEILGPPRSKRPHHRMRN
ncbi:hypothetical protein [Bacillus fonticola]|uniref:hypothetical protein n=1 Tax=Bacillus fonticola TaxID=2728853 RepID=UPI0014767829|nr:hypothetical protein [Bacillus fonticola]